jgi:hypothetical protein
MLSHLGLLEVECDAPPYPIVRACRKLGLQQPEDVRWCRNSRFQRRHHGWMSFLGGPLWEHLLGRGEGHDPSCSCGQPLPTLESYSFTFQSGEQFDYALAQCPRCRTVYWEKL